MEHQSPYKGEEYEKEKFKKDFPIYAIRYDASMVFTNECKSSKL